ncbi:hypothetical protein ACA910_019083 [Epithemia clementina (nom. ined.)]
MMEGSSDHATAFAIARVLETNATEHKNGYISSTVAPIATTFESTATQTTMIDNDSIHAGARQAMIPHSKSGGSTSGPSDGENNQESSCSGNTATRISNGNKMHPNTVTTTATSSTGSATTTNNSSSDGDGDKKPEASRRPSSSARNNSESFLYHLDRKHHHHNHHTDQHNSSWRATAHQQHQHYNPVGKSGSRKFHVNQQQPHGISSTHHKRSQDDKNVIVGPWMQQPLEGDRGAGTAVAGTKKNHHPAAALVAGHHDSLAVPVGAAVAASDSYSTASDVSPGKNNNREDESPSNKARSHKSALSLLDPHNEPAFHKIRSSFKRLIVEKSTGHSSGSASSQEEEEQEQKYTKQLKRMSDSPSKGLEHHQQRKTAANSSMAATSSGLTSSRKLKTKTNNSGSRRLFAKHASSTFTEDSSEGSSNVVKKKKSAAQSSFGGSCSSGSEEDNCGEGTTGNSSGSGTDGGYDGSASSNDIMEMRKASSSRGGSQVQASGGDYSCSSPSGSSSEDNGVSRRNNASSKRSKANALYDASTTNNLGGRGLCTTRAIDELDSSAMTSDIADFSSGATESVLAKTIKALKDDDDDDELVLYSRGRGADDNNGNEPASSLSGESISSSSHGEDYPSRSHHNGGAHHHRKGRSTAFCVPNRKIPVTSNNASFSSNNMNGDRKRRAPGTMPISLQDPGAKTANSKYSSQGELDETSGLVDARKHVRPLAADSCGNSSAFSHQHLPRRHYHHHCQQEVPAYNNRSEPSTSAKPPVMSVGSDVMAHILTFLGPPEILSVLTTPLSKDWIATYTRQSELWRVLCLLEPFKANVLEDPNDDSSDESSMVSGKATSELRHRFGKYRILYSSFVRCMRYLARIKDDAISGRQPSVIDYGASGVETTSSSHRNISSNQNLQNFLARARGVVAQHNCQQMQQDLNDVAMEPLTSESSDDERRKESEKQTNEAVARGLAAAATAEPIGVADDGRSTESPKPKKEKRRREKDEKAGFSKKRKVRYSTSKLTQRLLLPAGGYTSNTELPWSCAIYSIVNWMVCFADVEGMQTMCLKVLPFLLEDEQQRMTAQRAGLTDVVLRDMVLFPHSERLHTAAFHTIVLLARPLGGREGMLFHSSMVNSSGIFSGTGTNSDNYVAPAPSSTASVSGASNGKNGIAVLLDSMTRFQGDEVLQAMSCWSLVNIALSPVQKDVLIKLGGVGATLNAMVSHPYSAEVQFRALFALINLVIPCPPANYANGAAASSTANSIGGDASAEDFSAREVLDDMVEQIVELVVLAMKNFCSSESILNRACLVLHNLSLTTDYHGALLWTPSCYEMLEWCLSNYRNDQVLQQSAAGTLHRLQITLSSNESLRSRFQAAVASQQQLSLEQARNEAIMLHEEQQLRLRLQQQQNQEQQLAVSPSMENGD